MEARRIITALVTALLIAGSLAPGAAAAPAPPQLQLVTASDHVTTYKYGRQPVYLDLGVYVAALGSPLELWARRTDYTTPVELVQVIHDPDGGASQEVVLPPELMDGWSGLKDFFRVTVRDPHGAVVKEKVFSFCPSGYDVTRINDDGPSMPRYPAVCFGNPFTKGLVWGIDAGWGVNTNSSFSQMRLPVGEYTTTIAVEPPYLELFGIGAEHATATLGLTVERIEDGGCPKFCEPPHSETYQASRAVPVVEDPDPALLPDLIALPAFGIFVREGRARTRLTFGANAWVAGASSLVVEGFRRSDEPVMDAYQYFYDGDEVIGRAPVGEFGYDTRDGHTHWHFQQFARYSLLDATQTEVVLSKKEAFCLAPTDAIDLTLPGADWSPGRDGFGTQCGSESALWIREVLPLGWGDTYYQGVPGQSFNITDLPNGTYYLKVEANPLGSLYEQTAENNASLREIIIGGEPGARTVEVPPWNGIDTEAPFQSGHH